MVDVDGKRMMRIKFNHLLSFIYTTFFCDSKRDIQDCSLINGCDSIVILS